MCYTPFPDQPDKWVALNDRACVLLLLILVALERGGAQVAIAELAQEVGRAGADVEPPITVDFRERSERVAFADGLDLLCAWRVIGHTSGSHESYSRREQGDDEALFTVDRRRLALLLRDRPRRSRQPRSTSSSTRPDGTRPPRRARTAPVPSASPGG